MRAFASRVIDARNTVEGKILSVLLSVLLVASLFNVAVFTMKANATEEEFTETISEQPADVEKPAEKAPGASDIDENTVDKYVPEGQAEQQPEPAPIMTLDLGDPMPIDEGEDPVEAYIAELQEKYGKKGKDVDIVRKSISPDKPLSFDELKGQSGGNEHRFNRTECGANLIDVDALNDALISGNANSFSGVIDKGYIFGNGVAVLLNTAKGYLNEAGSNVTSIIVLTISGFTPEELGYTVIYDLNGGVTTSKRLEFNKIKAQSKTPTIEEPTRDGYTFECWSPAWSETVAKDITYVAQWKKNDPTSVPSTPLDIQVRYLVQWIADDGATLKAEEVRGPEPIVNDEDKDKANVVSVTDADKAPITADGTHYVFDANNENNVLSGELKTIKSDDDIVTLKLYFTEDVLGGDEPGMGDNVPDKYQVTVTYKAVNGTVDIEKAVVTLKDKDGKWAKDGIGHLTEAQIAKATANTGYSQNSELWTGSMGAQALLAKPTEGTDITEDTEYTIYFDPSIFIINVEVVNGTVEAASGQPTLTEEGGYVQVGYNNMDSFSFAPNVGYALDSVTVDGKAADLDDEGWYSFSKVTASHSIKVVYAEDKIGADDPENPDKADGVPDKYQATVNYMAINGTVNFSKAVVTLKDKDGKWAKDGVGHLTEAQIATATAGAGYNQSSEYWTGNIGSQLATAKPTTETEITGNSMFIAFFDPSTYVLAAKVVNGSVEAAMGQLATSEDGYTYITVNHNGGNSFGFQPKDGYALDTVKVDGELAELDDEGWYGFMNVTGNHFIEVVYAGDEIGVDDPDKGDGVPDKYQATVNYMAINGTVDIEKAVVTLKDKDGKWAKDGVGHLTEAQIATATANTGFDQNSELWVTAKPTPVSAIVEDTNFYIFFDPAKFEITVEVVNGSVEPVAGQLSANEDGSYSITVNYNGGNSFSFQADEGYTLDSVTVDGEAAELDEGSYGFTKVISDHAIKVVYAEDKIGTGQNPNEGDGVADKYQVAFNYVAGANGTIQGVTKKVVTLGTDENPLESANVVAGTVDVIPTPDEGYRFTNVWTGVDNEGNACPAPTVSFLVKGGSEYTFTASFEAIPAPVVPAPTTPVPPVVPGPGAPAGPIVPAGVVPGVAAPAPEDITDDATPMAQSPEGEEEEGEEEILDDENPLGAFDVKHCWTHWMMLLGMLLTAAYGIAVARRRSSFAKDIDDFEKSVTGEIAKKRGTVTVRTGSHQAI